MEPAPQTATLPPVQSANDSSTTQRATLKPKEFTAKVTCTNINSEIQTPRQQLKSTLTTWTTALNTSAQHTLVSVTERMERMSHPKVTITITDEKTLPTDTTPRPVYEYITRPFKKEEESPEIKITNLTTDDTNRLMFDPRKMRISEEMYTKNGKTFTRAFWLHMSQSKSTGDKPYIPTVGRRTMFNNTIFEREMTADVILITDSFGGSYAQLQTLRPDVSLRVLPGATPEQIDKAAKWILEYRRNTGYIEPEALVMFAGLNDLFKAGSDGYRRNVRKIQDPEMNTLVNHFIASVRRMGSPLAKTNLIILPPHIECVDQFHGHRVQTYVNKIMTVFRGNEADRKRFTNETLQDKVHIIPFDHFHLQIDDSREVHMYPMQVPIFFAAMEDTIHAHGFHIKLMHETERAMAFELNIKHAAQLHYAVHYLQPGQSRNYRVQDIYDFERDTVATQFALPTPTVASTPLEDARIDPDKTQHYTEVLTKLLATLETVRITDPPRPSDWPWCTDQREPGPLLKLLNKFVHNIINNTEDNKRLYEILFTPVRNLDVRFNDLQWHCDGAGGDARGNPTFIPFSQELPAHLETGWSVRDALPAEQRGDKKRVDLPIMDHYIFTQVHGVDAIESREPLKFHQEIRSIIEEAKENDEAWFKLLIIHLFMSSQGASYYYGKELTLTAATRKKFRDYIRFSIVSISVHKRRIVRPMEVAVLTGLVPELLKRAICEDWYRALFGAIDTTPNFFSAELMDQASGYFCVQKMAARRALDPASNVSKNSILPLQVIRPPQLSYSIGSNGKIEPVALEENILTRTGSQDAWLAKFYGPGAAESRFTDRKQIHRLAIAKTTPETLRVMDNERKHYTAHMSRITRTPKETCQKIVEYRKTSALQMVPVAQVRILKDEQFGQKSGRRTWIARTQEITASQSGRGSPAVGTASPANLTVGREQSTSSSLLNTAPGALTSNQTVAHGANSGESSLDLGVASPAILGTSRVEPMVTSTDNATTDTKSQAKRKGRRANQTEESKAARNSKRKIQRAQKKDGTTDPSSAKRAKPSQQTVTMVGLDQLTPQDSSTTTAVQPDPSTTDDVMVDITTVYDPLASLHSYIQQDQQMDIDTQDTSVPSSSRPDTSASSSTQPTVAMTPIDLDNLPDMTITIPNKPSNVKKLSSVVIPVVRPPCDKGAPTTSIPKHQRIQSKVVQRQPVKDATKITGLSAISTAANPLPPMKRIPKKSAAGATQPTPITPTRVTKYRELSPEVTLVIKTPPKRRAATSQQSAIDMVAKNPHGALVQLEPQEIQELTQGGSKNVVKGKLSGLTCRCGVCLNYARENDRETGPLYQGCSEKRSTMQKDHSMGQINIRERNQNTDDTYPRRVRDTINADTRHSVANTLRMFHAQASASSYITMARNASSNIYLHMTIWSYRINSHPNAVEFLRDRIQKDKKKELRAAGGEPIVTAVTAMSWMKQESPETLEVTALRVPEALTPLPMARYISQTELASITDTNESEAHVIKKLQEMQKTEFREFTSEEAETYRDLMNQLAIAYPVEQLANLPGCWNAFSTLRHEQVRNVTCVTEAGNLLTNLISDRSRHFKGANIVTFDQAEAYQTMGRFPREHNTVVKDLAYMPAFQVAWKNRREWVRMKGGSYLKVSISQVIEVQPDVSKSPASDQQTPSLRHAYLVLVKNNPPTTPFDIAMTNRNDLQIPLQMIQELDEVLNAFMMNNFMTFEVAARIEIDRISWTQRIPAAISVNIHHFMLRRLDREEEPDAFGKFPGPLSDTIRLQLCYKTKDPHQEQEWDTKELGSERRLDRLMDNGTILDHDQQKQLRDSMNWNETFRSSRPRIVDLKQEMKYNPNDVNPRVKRILKDNDKRREELQKTIQSLDAGGSVAAMGANTSATGIVSTTTTTTAAADVTITGHPQ